MVQAYIYTNRSPPTCMGEYIMLRRLLLVGVATGLLAGISVSDAADVSEVWLKENCKKYEGVDVGAVYQSMCNMNEGGGGKGEKRRWRDAWV